MLRPQLGIRNLQCCNALSRLRPGRRRTMKPARSLRESSAPPAPQFRPRPRPPERSPGVFDVPDDVPDPPAGAVVETDIPARLDGLPWSRFHTLVVAALGITWILDGLEVTLAGALSGILKDSSTLGLSNSQIGSAASAYLGGAVAGALFFGWLTDRLGRKKLFFITIAVYLAATAATALSWDFWSFALFRALTGAGIGGEYTAINSTIQELIPARMRGWTDLVINGSFWIGAALGAAGSMVLLDPAVIDPAIGWRLAFLIGAALGTVIFVMRLWIPESPRWLVTHGQGQAANAVVAQIEQTIRPRRRHALAPAHGDDARPHPHAADRGGTDAVADLSAPHLRGPEPDGGAGVLLQCDLLHLCADPDRFLRRAGRRGRLVHPAVRGRKFPGSARARPPVRHARPQVHDRHHLCRLGNPAWPVPATCSARDCCQHKHRRCAWMIIFFFASAAASSAYLTVSETFPLEIRALAIAFFYAIGTGVGGVAGPWLFGVLIETGSRSSVAAGYLLGAALMVAAAAIEWRWGIAAERKPLESVCPPLGLIE